jgi:L-glyceraldehyde 3-phosphate reductase
VAETKKVTPTRALRPVQRDRLSWHQFAAAPERYEAMPYRRCGKSGLKLPAISLGAWETFGGYRGPEISRDCIFRAFNLGITHFDFANNYGRTPGRAETIVGRILREMPRDELIVSNMAGFLMWPGPYGQGSSRKHLVASLEQSLQRLGLDYVDIFYSHRFDAETPLEETLGALDQIVRQGKALYLGVSHYPPNEFKAVCELVGKKSRAPIVLLQSRYNMLERDLEGNLLGAAKKAGVGVIAFSPLAQGLLTTKYFERVPEESRAAKIWSEAERAEKLTAAALRRIWELDKIANDRGQTLPQMALAWILREPAVTSALVGASTVEQIEENVRALENPNFSAEELRRIDAALKS